MDDKELADLLEETGSKKYFMTIHKTIIATNEENAREHFHEWLASGKCEFEVFEMTWDEKAGIWRIHDERF